MANNQKRGTRKLLSAMMAAVMTVTSAFAVTPLTAAAETSVEVIDDTDGKFYACEALGATSAEWDGTVASGFAGGTGTKSSPYQIANGQQLAYLAYLVNNGATYSGKYFKLTADILLNDDVDDEPNFWSPIGFDNSHYFDGTFDGANHRIIGLYINDSVKNNRGLFGYTGANSVIKNLGVTDGRIVCLQYDVGSICGYNNGTISNCYNANKVSSVGSNGSYGGVCGTNHGSMVKCYNKGELYFTDSIKWAGGVCGYNVGEMSDCYNLGRVSSTSTSANLGGVCGINDTGTVANCYNTVEVFGYQNIGGVCGYNLAGTIKDCYNTGEITATYCWAGGICGYSVSENANDTILRCYNTGTITCTNDDEGGGVAGICGELDGYLIKQCYNKGTINGTHWSAGICGYVGKGEIRECYNSGTISCSSYSNIGGIVGGVYQNAIIENCYNVGNIKGSYYVGGVWGSSAASSNSMTNCYNAGVVFGVGENVYPVGEKKGQFSNVHYDSNVCKTSDTTNALWSKTTKQMTAATAISDLNFDASIWSKTDNTLLNLYYPDLANIAGDQPKANNNPVTGVTAVPSNGKVTVSWNALSSAEMYRVYMYEAGTYTRVYSGDSSVTSAVITNLTNGTKYGFVVSAKVSGVWSDYTNTADIVYAIPESKTPTIIGYKEGDYKVKLEWTALDGAEMYRVYTYRKGVYTRAFTCDGDRNVATVTGLNGGIKYGFVVSAKVNGVWTDYSDTADLVYAVPTGVTKPTITGYKAGDYQVKLEWTPIANAVMYRVYTYENGVYTRQFTCNGDRTVATVTGLNGSKKYAFVVSAKVGDAWSDYSDVNDLFYATTTGTPKPIITGYKTGDGKVKLEWTALEGAEMYRVYTYENGTYTRQFTCDGDRNVATVTGLTNGKQYAFVVSAKVNGAWTDYTNEAFFVYATPNA